MSVLKLHCQIIDLLTEARTHSPLAKQILELFFQYSDAQYAEYNQRVRRVKTSSFCCDKAHAHHKRHKRKLRRRALRQPLETGREGNPISI